MNLYDEIALLEMRRSEDWTRSQIGVAVRMLLNGDLIHVDAIAAWVREQDAEYRNDLLFELQAAAAEEQHEQRMRDGFPSSAEFAAHCLRTAGRGHLLGLKTEDGYNG